MTRFTNNSQYRGDLLQGTTLNTAHAGPAVMPSSSVLCLNQNVMLQNDSPCRAEQYPKNELSATKCNLGQQRMRYQSGSLDSSMTALRDTLTFPQQVYPRTTVAYFNSRVVPSLQPRSRVVHRHPAPGPPSSNAHKSSKEST